MIDNVLELKPCPLCGGEAKIESFSSAPHGDFVTIKCTGCGLTLDWTTDYYYSNIARVHANLTATQAWNRRAKQVVAIREPRWIPVTDRLPMGAKDGETSEDVVAYFVDNDIGAQVCTGWLGGNIWNLVISLDEYHTEHRMESVTHWMPLPKPPTPEECSAVGELMGGEKDG